MKITEYGPAVQADVEATSDDYVEFKTEPFTLTTGNYALKFEGLNKNGGENTALIDAVMFDGTLVEGGGFEEPEVEDYEIAPSDSGWSYTGNTGIAANGGTITTGGRDAPEGLQVAFLTNDGSLSQSGSVTPGSYTLSFQAARAPHNDSYQQFRVTLSGALSTKTFVWSGNTIVEERDATGENVTKRFYPEGEQRAGDDAGNYYYTRDHLGSIREVTDANGGVVARYDYDPWGNAVVLIGKINFDFGFTGHYFHQPSGLNLAIYRAYSPTLARWIGRDPMGEDGGSNLYGYVENDPLAHIDRLGLCCDSATIDAGEGALRAQFAIVLGGAGGMLGGKSCEERNIKILYPHLGPVPKCWTCFPEHRYRDPDSLYLSDLDDHWWVTCRAKDDNGNIVKEIVFDLWGTGSAGGPRQPYLDKYPLPGRIAPPERAPLHLGCDGTPFRPRIPPFLR